MERRDFLKKTGAAAIAAAAATAGLAGCGKKEETGPAAYFRHPFLAAQMNLFSSKIKPLKRM
jgi:hypothetical protein